MKVRGGWHGSNNDLSVAVHAPMDVPESSGLPAGLTEYTRTISFNDTEGTIAAIHRYASDLAGVLIEAVGQYFIPPGDGFLPALQEELRKVGSLFILDEVITGARLSLSGAQGWYGLKPDLSRGIPARCFGVGSLFTTCFPSSADIPLRNIEDIETQTDIPRRDKEFRLRMLNKGVYMMYGGGALSMAHTEEDMLRIIRAAEETADEMSIRKD